MNPSNIWKGKLEVASFFLPSKSLERLCAFSLPVKSRCTELSLKFHTLIKESLRAYYRNHQFNNFLVRRRKNYGSLIKSILVSVM